MNAEATVFDAAVRQRWRGVRKVLAVRLDNLGDVLMTTPALTAMRQSLPGVHLTLLASPSGATLAPFIDDVDDVIAYDAPWMKGGAARKPGTTPDEEWAIVRRLAAEQFDAAVIFTCYTQSALPAAMLCRQAGIGLRLAHCRENPYGLLTDWVPDPEPQAGIRHEVERQLALVGAVGLCTDDDRMSFDYRSEDLVSLCAKLETRGVTPKRPWVVVHPGATAPSRRYPAGQFGAAADLIANDINCHVLFTGTADEADLVLAAQARMQRPGISLAGQLSLGELAALIAHSKLLVSSNSGPVHIAAAVGTPVVDLYALTNPQHTPWRVPSRVLNRDVPCRNCLKSVCPEGHHNCLRLVTPEEVAQAAHELIELQPEPQHWEPEQEDEHGGVLHEGNTASAVFAMATAQAALAS
ncbi:glycosyltransferase family 9 protein [Methylibium rhizosphaerae]|uniref:glycosyltransferase family 9 protein n=1 Tax=Methylibium rhizosphaerae TaxID=2570323 RepID=UPI00112A2340|nr:glycosyltransferase family 9 protein [Methylibium rhizosphaerae]